MSWQQIMQNPKGMALRAFMQSVLQNKYPPYDDVVSRISVSLVTDNDVAVFAKMVNDIFEAGYHRAVGEYKTQLTKMGIHVNVTTKSQAESQT